MRVKAKRVVGGDEVIHAEKSKPEKKDKRKQDKNALQATLSPYGPQKNVLKSSRITYMNIRRASLFLCCRWGNNGCWN
jgi:hypothetical protein